MQPLTIATLGTGSDVFLTRAVEKALKTAKQVVLRTARHPMTRYLDEQGIAYVSLDDLYDQCDDFDALNQSAAHKVLALCERQPVCYAVSDAAYDATVAALRQMLPDDAPLTVLPGVSHAQRCLALVRGDTSGLRVYTATEFASARVSPAENLLLLEIHSRECAGDCKLKLMNLMPEEMTVLFFSGSEKTGRVEKKEVPLYELDRQKRYDHLTAVYVPGLPFERRTRYDMDDLTAIMRRLLGPDGCPWDRQQTYESLLPSLLEESYEYIQAVREGDIDHMYDELGDVLFQVAFHAALGRQHGDFDLDDVTTAICGKMIERHPHVFGAGHASDAGQVLEDWEARKRRQRGYTTVAQAMEGVSTALSPLMRAAKVQEKAAKTGFDGDALQKARQTLDGLENKPADEQLLGKLLFFAAALCRQQGQSPDLALTEATNRFITRFSQMENLIKSAGKCFEGLTLSEMDVYWNTGKQDS